MTSRVRTFIILAYVRIAAYEIFPRTISFVLVVSNGYETGTISHLICNKLALLRAPPESPCRLFVQNHSDPDAEDHGGVCHLRFLYLAFRASSAGRHSHTWKAGLIFHNAMLRLFALFGAASP